MIKFNVIAKELKMALTAVVAATGDVNSSIHSHALFKVGIDSVLINATDEDKIASASCVVKGLESDEEDNTDICFSADPKKILSLLNSSDTEETKLEYDKETKTLNVYVSSNSNTYISFASFDPKAFVSFTSFDPKTKEEKIEGLKELKSIPAGAFLTGVKFIQGFLPKDDQDKKYSNLFIEDGVMYGANGVFKVGAFKCGAFKGMPTIVIRRAMLSHITAFINKSNSFDIEIKISNKFIIFSSPLNGSFFGFKKSLLSMIKIPISLQVPTTDGINIDRGAVQKRLNRLAISSWEDIGLNIRVKGSKMHLETISDRKSFEQIECIRISGEKEIKFIVECVKFKNLLNLYSASNVDIYVDKKYITAYSTGELIDKDNEEIKTDFSAIGVMTLAQVV